KYVSYSTPFLIFLRKTETLLRPSFYHNNVTVSISFSFHCKHLFFFRQYKSGESQMPTPLRKIKNRQARYQPAVLRPQNPHLFVPAAAQYNRNTRSFSMGIPPLLTSVAL